MSSFEVTTTSKSTYYIGICSLANTSIDNGAAVIQRENNASYVLGQLNQVNLAGGG